jgi:hypothetical protein
VGKTGTSRLVDRRAAERFRILQRCFVHPAGAAEGAEAWRCIAYNLSATGVGVALPIRLPIGTVLTIQAWNLPRARPLAVRVVRVTPVEHAWFAGCELLERLSDGDLQIWCNGPLDWLDHPPQA